MSDEASTLTPTPDEWQVLWSHHTEAERVAANRGEYDDAKYHKDRAAAIARHIAPADAWERAWGAKA